MYACVYIYIAKGSVHICQHGICIRTLATSQTLVGSSRELRGSLMLINREIKHAWIYTIKCQATVRRNELKLHGATWLDVLTSKNRNENEICGTIQFT